MTDLIWHNLIIYIFFSYVLNIIFANHALSMVKVKNKRSRANTRFDMAMIVIFSPFTTPGVLGYIGWLMLVIAWKSCKKSK